jgi:hypothetical protein
MERADEHLDRETWRSRSRRRERVDVHRRSQRETTARTRDRTDRFEGDLQISDGAASRRPLEKEQEIQMTEIQVGDRVEIHAAEYNGRAGVVVDDYRTQCEPEQRRDAVLVKFDRGDDCVFGIEQIERAVR